MTELPAPSECAICGHQYWGVGEICTTCEIATRHEGTKGFQQLCAYLETVTAFEEYLRAREESGSDLAPADSDE